MRIISGKYRGKIIHPPKNLQVRPTTDLAKESLFNIITNHFHFEAIRVLDLFSGTGSISYEFASRNCPEIHLVENNFKNYDFILRTISELGFDQIRATKANVRSYLETCRSDYDIVFADPPYDLSWLVDLPEMVMSGSILKPGGWFILEHPRSLDFTRFHHFMENRRYGGVNFSIFIPEKKAG